MEEITLNDLLGTWLGEEYNLIIGHNHNPSFARLFNKVDDTIIETSNLKLSDVTEDNTRMFVFSEEFSIEIWSWNTTEMTLTINNDRYDVALNK